MKAFVDLLCDFFDSGIFADNGHHCIGVNGGYDGSVRVRFVNHNVARQQQPNIDVFL
jgi:hypothetical protein